MELPALIVAVLLPLLSSLFVYLTFRRSSSKPKSSGSGLSSSSSSVFDWTPAVLEATPTGTVVINNTVFTADPATVEHILKTRFDIYVKGILTTGNLHDFLGQGIFIADGDHWRLQRRVASLEFTTKTIRTFIMSNVQLEAADRLLPFLSSAAASGKPFNLQELLESFAFDNVCRVVFNEDPARLGGGDSDESREFYEAFEEATCLSMDRSWGPLKLKRLFRVGSEGRLRRQIRIVNRFAKKVIEKRRESLGDDLISRFISENNGGAGYSDEFLRDIVVSFVVAGRDTTSATLTWFFWLIGRRPEVKDRIVEEIRLVRSRSGGGGGNSFTLEQVREMEYLHAALSETLRLYSPVPINGRTCSEDDVLPDGTKVKKGTMVLYCQYAMGRSKRLWGDDWEEFRPERWLDESGRFQTRSPYEYPVFHAGPRTCLGKDMAYIQMKMVAATVMERFDVVVAEAEEKEKREMEYVMTMKMKGGLMVTVKEL